MNILPTLYLFFVTAVVMSYRIEVHVNIDIPDEGGKTRDGNCNKSNITWTVSGTPDGSETKANKPKDCVEAKRYNPESGVVTIFPEGSTPLQVYCDMDTDGGGWTVFQRRQDGSVDFYRNWTEYQNGFGDLNGEFWLGLDALHMLTSRKTYELRVDLMMWNGTKGYATYSNFSISDSSDNYRLHFDNFTEGNAGDSLQWHRDYQFTTKDRNNQGGNGNCAVQYHGAWWYNACQQSNLNGYYKTSGSLPGGGGLNWNTFVPHYYSMEFTEMKFRPT